MLIVVLQDDIEDIYAIWNTVTDRFLGVNLEKQEAVEMIMDYKKCSYENAYDRVEHPQSFIDIENNILL